MSPVMHTLVRATIGLSAIFVLAQAGIAAMQRVAHPFILWTNADAAAIRQTLDAEPWARAQLDAMGAIGDNGTGAPFVNLFKYQVLGDQRAGEIERKNLLHLVGRDIPRLQKEVLLDQNWRHLDNYIDALRYDVLYDSLTPEERTGVEATFRAHVQYVLDNPYVNTRLSLLPNMQMPYMMAVHMMALSLQDEDLIRRIWAAPTGFRWFFNDYLADGGLYNEEFAKMSSLIGEMLLFCRGLDRLGLSELGYDFTGQGGATMERYVESLLWIGYPRVEIPGGEPAFPRVSMGDTRGGSLLQHVNIPGYYADGSGGSPLFFANNMNGRDHQNRKVDKLQLPQWFEMLAAKYPNGPFGYFLAQMRKPADDKYYPTLFWGLKPIGPRAVTAPAAPSRVFPQRGFAVLHANESPSYWESPDPAVALQFATLYVHYTSDCFSLLGFQAFNRPIYVNRSISAGYNGGPWDFSVRGHCGVVVDNLQAQPIGEVPVRQQFTPQVKFVSARGKMLHPDQPYQGRGEVRSSDQPKVPATEVYPGVDLSRSLFLTQQYLFDVYQLSSAQPRRYDWLVHAPGALVPQNGQSWQPSDDLQRTLLSIPEVKVDDVHKLNPGAAGVVIITLQTCALKNMQESAYGKAWYDRKIGVRVWMLGEPDTAAYAFTTPVAYTPGSPRAPKDPAAVKTPETGGVSLDFQRTCPRTMFVALHEPFEHGTPRIETFRRIQQTSDAVAVAVVGPAAGVDDRILLRIGDDYAAPTTLQGDGERFTFADHAFVRVGADRVEVTGNLQAMRLKVTGMPALVINGTPAKATVAGGFLTFGE